MNRDNAVTTPDTGSTKAPIAEPVLERILGFTLIISPLIKGGLVFSLTFSLRLIL